MIAPAYGSGSIADVVGSVCDGLAVPGAWDVLDLGCGDRTVVVVVDGLGHRQLADHGDLAPTLVAGRRQTLTSVVPSTTPVALTSIGTGLPPGSHGLVGAGFRFDSALLYPLAWGEYPRAEEVQPEPTWWERARRAGVRVSVVSPRAYSAGGLTGAALRGGDYLGADGPGERIAAIVAAAVEGESSLVYGYWEFLDRAAHMFGVDSPQYRAELVAVDRWIEQLAGALPADVRLLVTSDHGVIDCPDVVDIDDRPALYDGVAEIAGEPRFRHVYTAPGVADAVAQRWRDDLGDVATVHTRDDAVARGWFGPVDSETASRIGDVVAVAQGSARLAVFSRDAGVSSLIGQHGALSAAEMEVPLLDFGG